MKTANRKIDYVFVFLFLAISVLACKSTVKSPDYDPCSGQSARYNPTCHPTGRPPSTFSQDDVRKVLVAWEVGLIIPTLIMSVIEAVVMLLLKWDKFGYSLQISLLMNVTSTIFGIGSVLVGTMEFNNGFLTWSAVAIAFLLSVLIEGGILMLMKLDAARLNWIVSLTANVASYLLIILLAVWRMLNEM